MTALLLVSFFGLGAVLASFVGVIAERAYTGESWLKGRSRCNACGRVLNVRDLIPVLSWLFARGRCRVCGARVPAQYMVFELFLGALFAFSYFTLGLSLLLPAFLFVILVTAFIVLYDLRHTVVPIPASVFLIVGAFVYSALSLSSLPAFLNALWWALGIAFCFFALHALSRGKYMGLGDTPVAFALSLVVAPYALSGVLFSFWSGALIGILMLSLRRGGPKMGIEVPFVPFLALGFLLAYFIQWNPLAPLL